MPDDRKFPTLSDSCKFKKGKSQAIKQSRRYFEFYKIYYTYLALMLSLIYLDTGQNIFMFGSVSGPQGFSMKL